MKKNRFQTDENGLLIATDVAARGLDIPNIEHVVHYQVPRTSEVCISRYNKILIMCKLIEHLLSNIILLNIFDNLSFIIIV